MYNYIDKMEIFSVTTDDDYEKAMKFNEKYKKEIGDIEKIFQENLNKYEYNKFLDIINDDDINTEDNDVEIIDNYKPENTIKEYISISMIKSKNNQNSNLYDIILFIPTEDNETKNKINEYVNINNKELLKNIIYGSHGLYEFVNNMDEEI